MKYLKIAVFGSAFNPPHMGHADVITQALAHFDRIILVPNFAHAFGKTMAPFNVRLDMTKLLQVQQGWGERVIVSDIEQDLAATKAQGEPIYTFDVMKALAQSYPACKLTFIVGPDNANAQTWAKFYKSDEIEKQWGRWVAQEKKPIRSTAIRALIEQGQQPPPDQCPTNIAQRYYQYFIQQNSTDKADPHP